MRDRYINELQKERKKRFISIEYYETMELKDESIVKSVDELIKWQIILRRNEVIDTLEEYYRRTGARSKMPLYILQSKIKSLYTQLRSMMKRSMGKDDFQKISELVDSNNFKELERGLYSLDDFMDKKGINRADFNTQIQGKTGEATNAAKGI